MPVAKKETLYIDIEDEITAVIEKVVSAKPKIIAVVLPKRATVFQSNVNMKLLQKAAKNAMKNIVLITSDKSIIAISASVGLMVAKTPTSKPSIPLVETSESDQEPEVVHVAHGDDSSTSKEPSSDESDSIELDNTNKAEPELEKKKTKKLLKVPDFSSFKLRMALSVVVIAGLGISWFYGFVVLPKAVITIDTDISTSSVNAVISAKIGDESLDLESNILPASHVQIEKIDMLTVPATGEKNIGSKATGTMNLENCINDGEDKILPQGTSFSSGGQTFVTTEAITLDFAIFAGSTCVSADFGRDADVGVIAANPGPEFNLDAGSYTSSISGVNAYGSKMAGGTSELVKVISQEDVDRAAQELSGLSKSTALGELKQQLTDEGLRAIEETLSEGTPKVVSSPAIDAEATEVKVTRTISYSMLGVSDSELAQIIENEVRKNLGDAQQNIRDNGITSVVFQVLDKPNESEQTLGVQTVATIGPDIDVDSIRSQAAGMKRGDIEKLIESIDGVQSVTVEYSPGWITTTPKSADKIEINFNENDGN